ncbi:eukaryotic translation elongation factor 1 epsilon-1 isoform X2 [Toxorhynchites rutilus septentrionalis]|uniref:eukaryotic translation elongation factor 1 epsilon-1 isoform X2 n=1 Tax=Toxorhynchites rutilus septentrionalis TaxID=329112 RepID=UPI00247A412A|nr:eukaryotic translation elongation factor 1 epsilon-1 isoform X2 [Toxorhynchites rutilus septentrionalis]
MGIVENVNNAANFMKVAPGKIGYNSEKIITRYISKTNESISGYSSILQSLARDSKNLVARESLKDIETELQVAQWIDYSVLFVSPAARDKHVAKVLLDELNEYLGTRSYLVNHTLTLADIVVFYSIQDTMLNLQSLEKENYLNVSRWFNHLQQQKAIRQSESLINFSTLHLLGWATGTHV